MVGMGKLCPFCGKETDAWSTDGGCMRCFKPTRTRVWSVGFETPPPEEREEQGHIPNRPHKKDCQPKAYETATMILISCTCYPPKEEYVEYKPKDNK